MNKPYRDGVTLFDILRDGWSRGFNAQQTVDEAAAMGYNTSVADVWAEWKVYDAEMEEYFAAQHTEVDMNAPWNHSGVFEDGN